MTEYFLTVMAVALAGGIVISICPTGASAQYVRLLCGLCTVCCVAFPLVGFMGGFDEEYVTDMFAAKDDNQEYYDEIYNNSLDEAEINNAEITLKSDIIKDLNAENDAFELNIIYERKSDEFFIERIEVIIYPQGLELNPREIEKHIKARLNCPCEFFYK